MSQGRNHSRFIIRILELIVLNSNHINAFVQFIPHLVMSFLLRACITHFQVNFLMKIFRKINVLRDIFTQSRLFLNFLKPQVLFSLVYSQSLLLAFQKMRDKIFQEMTILQPDGIFKRESTFENIGYRIRVIFRLKRGVSSHQLVNSDSKSPKVNSLIIASSNINFRSQVKLRSNDSQHIPSTSSLIGFLADSEIYNFYSLFYLIVQYVLRLDISVANIFIVKIRNSSKNLLYNMSQFRFIFQSAFSETFVGHIVHDQKGTMLILINVECSVFDY